MTRSLSTVRRLERPAGVGLRVLEDIIPCVLLAVIVVLVTTDVTLRYLLGRPIEGAGTVATLLFVWTSFLGASGAVRRKLHIGFDVLVQRCPQRVSAAVEVVTCSLIVAVLMMVLVFGSRLTLDAVSRPLLPFDMSYAWLTAAIPTGAALMMLRFVVRLSIAIRTITTGATQTRVSGDRVPGASSTPCSVPQREVSRS